MRVRDILPIWRFERFLQQRRDRRTRLFTDEMLEYNLQAAQRHGVEPACHAQDLIYEFIIKHASFRGTREVRQQTGEGILDYRQGFWWDLQDLWVVKKTRAPSD